MRTRMGPRVRDGPLDNPSRLGRGVPSKVDNPSCLAREGPLRKCAGMGPPRPRQEGLSTR